VLREDLVDSLPVRRYLRLGSQGEELHLVFLIEAERLEVRSLAVDDQASLVVPGVGIAVLEGVLLDRLVRVIQRWNERHEVVQADIVRLEHAFAAHVVA
jgi:hypothetical protein